MPKAMEEALKKKSVQMARSGKLHRKPGQTTKQAEDAFVYGTMRKTGWKPGQGEGRGKSW